MTKLVFKARDEYRNGQSVFELWADVRVRGQDGVQWNLGLAVMPQAVFFGPPSTNSFAPAHHDPWMRAVDRLILDLDHRQLDEIEQKCLGGPLSHRPDESGRREATRVRGTRPIGWRVIADFFSC